MTKRKIKKGDMVVVISGAEKNKRGRVLEVKAGERAWVEGVNLRPKAMRRTQERPQGGIVEQERPIHISNLMEQERYERKVESKNNSEQSKQEAES